MRDSDMIDELVMSRVRKRADSLTQREVAQSAKELRSHAFSILAFEKTAESRSDGNPVQNSRARGSVVADVRSQRCCTTCNRPSSATLLAVSQEAIFEQHNESFAAASVIYHSGTNVVNQRRANDQGNRTTPDPAPVVK